MSCPGTTRGEPSAQDDRIQRQLGLHRLRGVRRHAELVLGMLVHYGPLRQADLEAKMSSDTARQGVLRLGALGIVRQDDRHRLALDPSRGAVVGIDFGRRHIRVLLADLAMGKVASAIVEHVAVVESGRQSIEDAASMVTDLLDGARIPRKKVLGVGVALCGPWRQDLRVAPASVLSGWEGIRPEDELSRCLNLPVIADNDANLGALGEIAGGAADGCGNIVYLLPVGGVGCGLIFDGMIFRGGTGLSGEVGHTIIDSTRDPAAQRCQICHQHCLDDLFGGRKFVNELPPLEQEQLLHHERATKKETGLSLSGDERLAYVVRRAVEGNAGFRTGLEAATGNLAIVLANLCMVLDPQQIVIGGHLMANAAEIVLEPLRTEFRRRYKLHGLPEAADISILPAAFGEESQVRGAAALVLREPNATLLDRRREVLELDVTPTRRAEQDWRERRAVAGRMG